MIPIGAKPNAPIVIWRFRHPPQQFPSFADAAKAAGLSPVLLELTLRRFYERLGKPLKTTLGTAARFEGEKLHVDNIVIDLRRLPVRRSPL